MFVLAALHRLRRRLRQLPTNSRPELRFRCGAIKPWLGDPGQGFPAEITKDVLDSSGAVAIPHGSPAQLVIVSASKGGRIRGASDLSVTLASVTVGGQQFQVSAGNFQQTGKSGVGMNKRTAEFAGGGAGAIIGAIAGHGKGAAIGAAAGGGAGALTQVLTKGSAIQVPAETVLTFKLSQPLQIVAVN